MKIKIQNMEIDEYLTNSNELEGDEIEHYNTENGELVIYSSDNPLAWVKSKNFLKLKNNR